MELYEDSYNQCYKAFKETSNQKEVYESLWKSLDDDALKSATSALTIGCGSGVTEIDFFAEVLPSLKKASFEEPNLSGFTMLEKNLVSSDLSNKAECKAHFCTIQEWDNQRGKFDLILMSHCLYYFKARERTDLFKKCFDDLLNPKGIIYILMSCEGENGDTNLLNTVIKKVGCQPQDPFDVDRRELASNGRFPDKEIIIHIKYNLSLFNDGAINFIKLLCNPKREKEEIFEAIEVLKSRGYDGISKECLCVLKKEV